MSRLVAAERSLRIGFDFDDVLVKTAEGTTDLYNQRYGTELTADDWYNFTDMSRWGTEDFAEAARRVNAIFGSHEFAEAAEALEGAQEMVEKLRADGHALSIITGRPERLRPRTVQVAARLFPNAFSDESVYFTDHFSTKGKKVTKGEIGRGLELTHYVDDQIVHAESVAAAGIRVVLLGRRPWNASDVSPAVVRADNWYDLEEYFEHESR